MNTSNAFAGEYLTCWSIQVSAFPKRKTHIYSKQFYNLCTNRLCSATQILPEQLKTEEMCSNEWEKERECECQWETNLSRKTSRRNRMEARYRSHQQSRQHQQQQMQQQEQQQDAQKSQQTNADNGIEWRDPMPCTDADAVSLNANNTKEQWRDPVDYNEGGERWRDVNIAEESSDNDVFWVITKIYIAVYLML